MAAIAYHPTDSALPNAQRVVQRGLDPMVMMPDGHAFDAFGGRWLEKTPGYGPGVYSPRNPWRAPGASPVNGHGCGGYGGNMHGCHHADGTPAPCVVGGSACCP